MRLGINSDRYVCCLSVCMCIVVIITIIIIVIVFYYYVMIINLWWEQFSLQLSDKL